MEFVYNTIRITLPGLLQDGLEYLTLDVVRQLLTTVAPAGWKHGPGPPHEIKELVKHTITGSVHVFTSVAIVRPLHV